jgi:ketosteroid isomerase-like protein
MKHLLKYTLILLLSVSFSSHASGQTNQSRELIQLIKLNDEWGAKWVARDPDLMASYCEPNALHGFKLEKEGRTEISKAWAISFAHPELKLTWKTENAEISKSGDLAFITSLWTTSYKLDNGKMLNLQGTALSVWRKQSDGTWKVYLNKL